MKITVSKYSGMLTIAGFIALAVMMILVLHAIGANGPLNRDHGAQIIEVPWHQALESNAAIYAFLGLVGLLWLSMLWLLKQARTSTSWLGGSKEPGRAVQAQLRKTADDDQMDLMEMMGEIDRAILANASFKQITELVFANIHRVVRVSYVALTHLDTTLSSEENTLVSGKDGRRRQYTAKFDKALLGEIDLAPQGLCKTGSSDHPALSELATMPAHHFFLIPVYREGMLAAVLHFGMPEGEDLSEAERQDARRYAERLGVALTAVMRAKEIYIHEHFDPITGLPNRRHCIERLSKEISRAQRHELNLAVLYINLEGFKKVNDSAGYLAGDSVLKEVAHRLHSSLRDSDFLARLGNDEFVALLPETSGPLAASKVVEKLLDRIAIDFTYEAHHFFLNAAIGVSMYPEDGQLAESLLRNADAAMMRAKAGGQLNYKFYEEDMNSSVLDRLGLERDLRVALEQRQLYLVYQPQVDPRNNRVVGAEALVRWKHPQLGNVSPIQFIGIAEESNLICQLGEYVRRRACEQYRVWMLQGLEMPRIALNVSSAELLNQNFVENFMRLLNEFGLSTDMIELEVTESLFVESAGPIVDALKRINSQGIKVAVDDFGTGYSCLSYLASLPFDMLKVDRSFVMQIGSPSGSHEIASMIIDMAHHLGKTVCAEGVEDEHQKAFLMERGCEMLQGYLVSKPLVAHDFMLFVQEWHLKYGINERIAHV